MLGNMSAPAAAKHLQDLIDDIDRTSIEQVDKYKKYACVFARLMEELQNPRQGTDEVRAWAKAWVDEVLSGLKTPSAPMRWVKDQHIVIPDDVSLTKIDEIVTKGVQAIVHSLAGHTNLKPPETITVELSRDAGPRVDVNAVILNIDFGNVAVKPQYAYVIQRVFDESSGDEFTIVSGSESDARYVKPTDPTPIELPQPLMMSKGKVVFAET